MAVKRGLFLLVAVLAAAGCDNGVESTAPPDVTTTTSAATTSTGGTSVRATEPAPPDAAPTLRTDGLGPLTLGMSAADAGETGLIGPVGPGCELGGTEAASLKPPLAGTVDFSDGKLESIDLRGGAKTKENVGPNATVDEITRAYDGRNGFSLKRITETEEQFGIFLLEASKNGEKYTFVVETGEVRATSVAVPDPLFCE